LFCAIWLAALGRFPQLVDPTSSVNGQLLAGSPRFREVRPELNGETDRGAALVAASRLDEILKNILASFLRKTKSSAVCWLNSLPHSRRFTLHAKRID